MKIKDLDKDTNLEGVIVKTPESKIGYWHSQWVKGVWLKGKSSQIHPVFVDKLEDTLEWEVIENEELINLQ
jgi:hypothetical protein